MLELHNLIELNDDLLGILAVAGTQPAARVHTGVEQLGGRVLWVLRADIDDSEFKLDGLRH